MKTEKEILEHIEYLYKTTDRLDEKQLREFNIKLVELGWVLERLHSDQKKKDIDKIKGD